jgi:methyltransferase (TIGR00027 family)
MKRFVLLCLAVAALSPWGAGPVRAVPAGGISWTARFTCEFRALAALHPDPRLRGRDIVAAKFCEPVLLPRDYEAARDVIADNPEAYAGYFYVNARTHHIDAALERAAEGGALQVVVLGAGFDSRAYRYHEKFPEVVFFEVDLPATIEAKQVTVRRVFGALPAQVHYAPIDFNTQTLDAVLSKAGYEATKKTFFILEGVTMYVAEAGLAATFDFVRRHAASGSELVYDYILQRVSAGDTQGLYAATKEAGGVARVGEPFVTGWTPAQADAFARRHGLAVVRDLDAAELTRRYLIGADGKPDGRIPEWYRIIDARVP